MLADGEQNFGKLSGITCGAFCICFSLTLALAAMFLAGSGSLRGLLASVYVLLV